MASRPILLIGASCRAAAEALQRIGVRSMAWDMFADRDTFRACEVQRIESLASEYVTSLLELDRSLVLPCGGLENATSLWEEISRVHDVLGPTAAQLAKLRDPFWLSSFCSLTAFDVSFPDVKSNIDGLARDQVWLVKNSRSAAGLAVRYLKDGDCIAEGQFVQEFLDGDEFGVTVSCDKDASRILAATVPYPRDSRLGFHYKGSIGPVHLNEQMTSQIELFFNSLSRQLGFRGVLQADFIQQGNKLFLLEINPRWTAGMEIAETLAPGSILASFDTQDDTPSIDELTDLAKRSSVSSEFVVKRIIYASEFMRVNEAQSNHWMEQQKWTLPNQARVQFEEVQFRLADIPMPCVEIQTGHPLCSLLVRGRFADARGIELGSLEMFESLMKLTDTLDPASHLES